MRQSDEPTCNQLEARLALALSRSPRPFTVAEQALLRQRIERGLHQQRALRIVHLENGNEPCMAFDPEPGGRRHGEEDEA